MGFVAYYRVSTKKQGDSGLGLQSQRAILCHYLDCEVLVAEFTEVGSAKNINDRPQLQKAIALCLEEGHTLAIAKIDRLSRRTEDALTIWGKLDGRLYSCDIPQENGKMDKFTLTIFMAIADRERELISIRTKAALAMTKQKGTKLGNPDHLTDDARIAGQRVNRQKSIKAYHGHLNYIEMMRNEGQSYRKIAKQLNSEDKTTRLGRPFTAMTIKRILDRARV